VNTAVETAIFQWEEGHQRVLEARPDAARQRLLRRATEAIHAELRRRLGSVFTVAELVDLYREGTDWCLELAFELSGDDTPPDPSAATDAAFYLYMREASDFGGGKVVSDQ
jgi:hypothetical protein